MVWNKLVGIFGTFFLICAIAGLVIYLIERISYKKKLKVEGEYSEKKVKNLAIITGASSGLGKDYAKYLAENKEFKIDEFIIIARRKERLDELKESLDLPAYVYTMDMTNESEMENFHKFLEKKVQDDNIKIKYLINAAGSGIKGKSLDLGADAENFTGEINCKAQVSMIHIVANMMEAGGNIIQIASVAGLSPIAYLNAYSASKAYIYTYARGLRAELLPKGINLTTVCPYWVTDTEFMDKAKIDKKGIILTTKSKNVVKRSIKDTKRGFALSTPGLVASLDRIFSGLIPDEVLVYLTRLFV